MAELEYQNIERKHLANEVGFDVSNIGKGLKNGNVPLADTAVGIARFLGVSVEYLVTGEAHISKELDKKLLQELDQFHKYRSLLNKISSLPAGIQQPLIEMIENIKV